MLKLFMLVAIVLAIRPSTADACGNAVEWTTNDYVRVLVKAEKLLAGGYPTDALAAIKYVDFTGEQAQRAGLKERVLDVLSLINLRREKDLERVVTHFQLRVEQNGKSVRHRAWLAEAYVAVGNPELARIILDDLVKRDVMPDGFAYFALAKITSGPERLASVKACQARMKLKWMCDPPARQARR